MSEVKLYIAQNPDQQGEYFVTVDGTGFYNVSADARVGVRIRGSDKWIDDRLFNMSGLVSGGSFNISQSVPKSALNEDWGEDEVYALVDVPGYGEIKTNTIRGTF